MKVTLFGATGKTGMYLIDEGLKRGFDITVFARPSSSFENPNVRLVRGELTDENLLIEATRRSPSKPIHERALSARLQMTNLRSSRAMDQLESI